MATQDFYEKPGCRATRGESPLRAAGHQLNVRNLLTDLDARAAAPILAPAGGAVV